MIEILRFIIDLSSQTGIAAVFNKSLNLARKLNAAGHHGRCSTHTDAKHHDLAVLTIMLDQLVDPFALVIAFRPAVANIFTLALSLRAGIGNQNVIAQLMKQRCIGSHLILIAHKAMRDQDALISLFCGWDVPGIQPIVAGCGFDRPARFMNVLIPLFLLIQGIALNDFRIVIDKVFVPRYHCHVKKVAASSKNHDQKRCRHTDQPAQPPMLPRLIMQNYPSFSQIHNDYQFSRFYFDCRNSFYTLCCSNNDKIIVTN